MVLTATDFYRYTGPPGCEAVALHHIQNSFATEFPFLLFRCFLTIRDFTPRETHAFNVPEVSDSVSFLLAVVTAGRLVAFV